MLVTCLHCNTEFDKSNANIKKSPNHYCSRSCAAKETNKNPKRKRTRKCKCGEPILSDRKYCRPCYDATLKPNDYTLAEATYDHLHKSSAYALVRSRARSIAKQQGWKACCKCGYDKHIEIAHIKAIKDFDPDTLISQVNDVSNLLPLCPNCHWEFDHLSEQ